MRRSYFYIPTKTGINAELVKSYNIMVNAGMIRQAASGLFVWLPLGLKVLEKIASIISKHLDRHASRVAMPNIQPASLWHATGRIDSYGTEMLKIKDRNKKDLVYAPTHEEMLTYLLSLDIQSYRQLPVYLYQITNKFRDEIRPQGGVIRSKEFVMKDAYSCDLDKNAATATYERFFETYCNIFDELGVNYYVLPASNGEMGGSKSDEFIAVSDKGDNFTSYQEYKELNRTSSCDRSGIEIGHCFHLGNRYSKAIGLEVVDKSGMALFPEMGSYGIGITRLVAAVLENSEHNDKVRWHRSLKPFDVGIVRIGSCSGDKADKLYNSLIQQGLDVLYDDIEHSTPGSKFIDMDLIGIDKIIVISDKNCDSDMFELKVNKEIYKLELSQIIKAIIEK